MSTPVAVERLTDVDLPKVGKRSNSMLGMGVTGIVFPIDYDTVVKLARLSNSVYFDNKSLRDLWTERTIYKRLGSHPRICKYIRDVDRVIVLERLGDSLRKHLFLLQNDGGRVPPPAQALKWPIQAAEALAYIHTKSVIQGDVGCYNFLLDSNGDLKLCDFSGSGIDGCDPTVGPGTRPQLWMEPDDWTASIPSEIFALGSAIYEIWTTRQPYHDLSDKEVEERYKHQQFAELSDIPVDEIIPKMLVSKIHICL
ncbi:serine/threonine protein kinase [Helicocarpus griseus UAMH5409]|uniref:Serine/threonine protein kinase n=1 Tax=Helicocarpus griseus UAMH5409 TaxID=1447875 RepID=A0A2B7WZP4_9EURO|nr:serine/threonine protein kinase [Helicocarpus griseus UAMH5409]